MILVLLSDSHMNNYNLENWYYRILILMTRKLEECMISMGTINWCSTKIIFFKYCRFQFSTFLLAHVNSLLLISFY